MEATVRQSYVCHFQVGKLFRILVFALVIRDKAWGKQYIFKSVSIIKSNNYSFYNNFKFDIST